jgi:hypothetical protein
MLVAARAPPLANKEQTNPVLTPQFSRFTARLPTQRKIAASLESRAPQEGQVRDNHQG